jgi:hypothetical protein
MAKFEKMATAWGLDRAIREYVNSQSRDLKRRRSLRSIHYVVVLSSFVDDFDDLRQRFPRIAQPLGS